MPIKASVLLLIVGLLTSGCKDDPPQPEVGAVAAAHLPAAARPMHALAWQTRARADSLVRVGAAGEPLRLGAEADTRALAEQLAAGLRRSHPGVSILTAPLADAPTQGPEPQSHTASLALVAAEAPPGRGPRPGTAGLPVALHALVLVVHPDNPLAERGLTLTEIEQIFAAGTPSAETVEFWGDVGVAGAWTQNPVTRYGLAPGNSLRGFLQQRALAGAEFRADVHTRGGSAEVVRAVAADPNAIGYAALPFVGPGVAVVPIAERRGSEAATPTESALAARSYPLTLTVGLHLDQRAAARQREAIAALLSFVYSAQGQAAVAAGGYLPLPRQLIAETRQRLGLPPNHAHPMQMTEVDP